ncbi:hypothetical protein Mapa_016543 [Marchantia paleacea]|nr:hypothetical protein Mapa_016543 [Marchantia paleacea]
MVSFRILKLGILNRVELHGEVAQRLAVGRAVQPSQVAARVAGRGVVRRHDEGEPFARIIHAVRLDPEAEHGAPRQGGVGSRISKLDGKDGQASPGCVNVHNFSRGNRLSQAEGRATCGESRRRRENIDALVGEWYLVEPRVRRVPKIGGL